MNIKMQTTPIYRRLQKMYKQKDSRYLVLRGGTSSSKSISILQFLVVYALVHENKTINILNESMVKSKRGLIPDLKNIILKELIQYINFNKTESTFTFPNGSVLRFISAEDPGKVVGLRSDILYIDEVNTIKKDVINELEMRTREKIIASFNPTHIFEWYEETNKKKGFVEDVSNYLDNPVLEQAIIDDILERANKSRNYHRVHILGEFGTTDGLVFTEDEDWQIIKQLPTDYEKEGYGLDFGFKHKTGVVHARVIGNSIYIREMLYADDMVTPELAQELKDINPLNLKIFADSEDQQQIANLKRIHGINIRPVKKLTRLESIDNFKSHQVFITEDSVNLIKELRNYHYSEKKVDKKNRPLPEKIFDDLIDPTRYIIDTFFKPTSKTKIKTLKW